MAQKSGPIAICVINLKGGVGKSTITALLARHAFRNREANVLAIDLDPQANLSQALMGYSYNKFLTQRRPSIVEIFAGYQPPTTATHATGPLAPQQACETVATIGERTLQLIPSRFDFSDSLISAVRPDPKILARFLSANFRDKDLIIVDCAPTESILTRAAYHACGLVLVPVKPEFFATIGFPLLQESLRHFRSENRGHEISVAGVVINNAFYDGGNSGGPERTRSLSEIHSEAAKNKWKVFKNQMDHSRGYPKMMRGDYSYIGNAGYFYLVADEVLNEIGL